MSIWESFKGTMTFWILLVIGLIGLFECIYDVKILNREGLEREAKMAKWIGVSYVVLSVVLFVIVKVF